ncbi:MAG TPA: hypothetical protein VFE62_23280 [Gemmataceae bacterium]|nr:hypothetical protein [Gemmataceae bacterium]
MSGDGQPRNGEAPPISAAAFASSFGESILKAIDLATWRVGRDLSDDYVRIDREVRDAVGRETSYQRVYRERVFPQLQTRNGAPKNAGVHAADIEIIKAIHRDLLFRGGVEACDGAIQVHATLPLTIYQVGVSLVSYQGSENAWGQRLFRRDLRQSFDDPVEEAIALLERRARPIGSGDDGMGELIQKALLDYAERAILARRSKARWRMGHGNPITYELLTGGSNLDLMVAGTNVIRELVNSHPHFVFVASEPKDRLLFTIAQALHPMEFAIVGTLKEQLDDWLHQRRFAINAEAKLMWDDEAIRAPDWIPRFIETVASQIVVGLFRASMHAPAQLFYAHVDYADYAAHVVLADSVLNELRGAPMLIGFARHVCDAIFGDTLAGLAESAYLLAGAPGRFSNQRTNRQ